MKHQLAENIKATLRKEFSATGALSYKQGQSLYLNGQCALLSESGHHYRFLVNDKYDDYQVDINVEDEITTECTCKSEILCKHKTTALLQLEEYFRLNAEELPPEGIRYTRKGMIQRVIDERKKKAQHASYSIEFADNIYGEHILTNERGMNYRITFRDLERKHGYCNCPDYSTNKLGTCKHLIYAFNHLQENPGMIPNQLPAYPFVEVFLNPFRNNKISYFYPEKLRGPIAELFYRYFGNKNFIEENEVENFTGFLNNTHKFKQIHVRPEVHDKVRKIVEQASIERLKASVKLNFAKLKSPLLPFQKDGVEFCTFNTGAMLADDIELGKITQAVAIAVMKKEVFGFNKTLIICQAAMKLQWKRETEKLTGMKPVMVEGDIEQRSRLYKSEGNHFLIVNYETVSQDLASLIDLNPDFIILDEAQRIKNWASAISVTIRSIPVRHTLVLASSPFETRLMELYALMMLVDPGLLSPLWEFSYNYCYFDDHDKNHIVGYHNLDDLMQRLDKVLLRREKYQVIKQLPQISTIDVPVDMHPYQMKLHLKFSGELLSLINKKILTPYEHQQAIRLIRQLRMLADSSFLIDELTNISPKTEELKTILTEKLNLRKSNKRVIIFTEWKKMLQAISRSLRINKIRHVEITDETPEKQRSTLLSTFEKDEECKVLLVGNVNLSDINIQLADVVINFDVPATRDTKSARMGSLDKIIQRKGNMTIINLVAKNSLEERIAAGMELDALESGNDKEKNDMPHSFPKILQSEIIEALREINQKINLPEAEKFSLSRPGDSGQMIIDFSTEEHEFSVHQPTAVHKPADDLEMLGQKLNITPDKLSEALSGGASLIAQMLKLTSGKEIDITGLSQEFDPYAGEITLRYKVKDNN